MHNKVLREAIRQSDLSIRDKVLLRMALVIQPDKVEQAVKEATEESNLPLNAVEGSVDWQKVIKFFIENVLPALLLLLK